MFEFKKIEPERTPIPLSTRITPYNGLEVDFWFDR